MAPGGAVRWNINKYETDRSKVWSVGADREATRIVDRDGGEGIDVSYGSLDGGGGGLVDSSTLCRPVAPDCAHNSNQFDGISSSIRIRFRSSSF